MKLWDDRAAQFGKRAVHNIRHSDEEIEQVFTRQQAMVVPALQWVLRGTEDKVLDFGCGYGRWLPFLERTGGVVYGVDPSKALLDMNTHPKYRKNMVHMEGDTIPFPNAFFDMVWAAYTLCAIPAGLIDVAVFELARVLRPGGLFFIVDNTTAAGPSQWATPRSFETYAHLFKPWTDLWEPATYTELGEDYSIMAGRKR